MAFYLRDQANYLNITRCPFHEAGVVCVETFISYLGPRLKAGRRKISFKTHSIVLLHGNL